MKKITRRLICTLLSVLILFTALAGCSTEQIESTVEETVAETTTTLAVTDNDIEDIKDEVIVSGEVIEMAEDTKDAVEQKEDIATDDIPEGSISEEATIEDEQLLEVDAQVEQENISYDGAYTGKGKSLLGKCTGLTYYSQRDSRWANIPYTSTGNKSQTMSSSACGPTSAAMVVSSSKGAILPTTLAKLFVDNGYRTANNGTAWAAFPFVADYFGFNEYSSTTSFSNVEKALETDKNKDGISDYFVIVSCGSGLFTSGGHYIVLVGDKDNTLTVYDPYLYYGKFDTASRKAAGVKVSGNSAFVSESSFKKYANAKHYWIFSNDNEVKQSSSGTTVSTASVKYTRYVATQSSNLNVRKGAGMSYGIVTTLKKGTEVTVTKTSGNWSYIVSPATGWVSTEYLSASKVTATSSSATTVKYKTTIGSYYRLNKNAIFSSKGDFTGNKYNYLPQTQIKVISHYSAKVDYVYVVKLGLYRYAKVADYT